MNKPVNYKSLMVDGVDSKDYPDFTDSYICYGLFCDETEMTSEELDKFNETFPEIPREMAFESLIN